MKLEIALEGKSTAAYELNVSWLPFLRCDTEGNGKRYRGRWCDNPAPSAGGGYCTGQGKESQDCDACKSTKLTVAQFNPKYFSLKHGDQYFQFEIIINVLLALSVLFEYLCYGSTTIINTLILSVLEPSLS